MKAFADGVAVINQVICARTMRDRMRGLLGREELPQGTAMLIEPCGSIHTFGMKFDLDIVFLDKCDRVLRICRVVRPGRMRFGGFDARKVLEMQLGAINMNFLREGCQFQFRD